MNVKYTVAGNERMHHGGFILLSVCMLAGLGIGYGAGYLGLQVMTTIHRVNRSNVLFFVEKMREGIAGNRHCIPDHEGAIEQKQIVGCRRLHGCVVGA